MSDIAICTHDAAGYKPVVDYASWRVAFLNSDEAYLPEHLDSAQCHLFTDEVFVLIEGDCTLFTFGQDPQVLGKVEAVRMLPGKMYNVKQCAWHTHALSPGTRVLIVENRDTTNENSPTLLLDAAGRASLIHAYQAAKIKTALSGDEV